MNNSIKPGQPWLDTNGNRIQAHGGSVMYIDGVYYWYGENKEKTTGKDKIWHWGVRCYTSTDLYNWEDKGLIIQPNLDDPSSSLHPHRFMDRPHIIYCRKTGKYVCWLKIIQFDGTQSMTVLTADSILGPYTMVTEDLRPFGMSSGDFDLVVAPDGKAYWYFERVHSELICADLNDEYTGITGYYTTHFPHHEGPPYVREAPAHFACNGKHYLFTSGTTGYYPNTSEVAVADTWHGPFTVLGDPHGFDDSHTSFHSQISSVFKVHGKKDLYIACADRWLPAVNENTGDEICQWFKLGFYGHADACAAYSATLKHPLPVVENTSLAEYVWLPVTFVNGKPMLYWKSEWRIEDYD